MKDRIAIEKVKRWINGLKDPLKGEFIPIKNKAGLLDAVSNKTNLKDVDVLVLATHG